ncbi:MAG: nucleotidyl transferase AbiEii/AbiGii toxin family protein [Faecousia sp.]
MLDDRTISILAYNLETVLAEKIETVLSCGIANTRPRDFYDIHMLYTLRGAECSSKTLRQALERTADKRGSRKVLEVYPVIITEIRSSEQLRAFWDKYQRDFDYAKAISFDDVCDTVRRVMDSIMEP